MRQVRQKIDCDQVHEIHQEDPQKNGKGQRCDQRVSAAEGTLDAGLDEFNDPLGKILQAARHTGGRLFRDAAENIEKQHTQADGKSQGIDVKCPETHFLRLFGRVGDAPGTVRQLAIGQVLQVVPDIFG